MPVYRVQINLEIDTESKQTKLVNQRMFEGMPPTELVGGKRRGRPRKAVAVVETARTPPPTFANFSFHPGVSE